MLDPERCLAIDIDGVLCSETGAGDLEDGGHDIPYLDRTPITEAIEAVRALYLRGWHITLYTGRHALWIRDTQKWLTENRVLYNHIVMGKPPAKYYIDDRAINPDLGWPTILGQLTSPQNDD